MTGALGPAVSALDLRRSAQGVLETWMPSIVVELARRADAAYPPSGNEPTFEEIAVPPRSWTRLPDAEIVELAVDQTPAVVVSSGGTQSTERDSDGEWDGVWGFSVTVFVRGDTWEQTNDLAALYVAAARLAVLQHGTGIPSARKPRWAGETYREIETEVGRSLQAARADFTTRLSSVADDSAGPEVPPDAPDYVDPQLAQAEEVNVSVDAL